MNETTDSMLNSLEEFRVKPKFRCIEPEFRILSPSPSSVTIPLETALNNCAIELSNLVQNSATPKKLKNCITESINSIDKPFDTEDREYLTYYYYQLGECVGVNVALVLNRWLYGIILASVFRLFGRG